MCNLYGPPQARIYLALFVEVPKVAVRVEDARRTALGRFKDRLDHPLARAGELGDGVVA